MIDLASTEDRAIVRMRLADDLQLAAYTPRPRAPRASLASAQVHESAVNNFLERLELDGKDFDPIELRDYVIDRLGLPAEWARRELPDDVVLWFAEQDSVRLDFHDDEIRITLRLDGLECSAGYFDGFEFSISYHLTSNDGRPELVRDEAPSLSGRRMGFRERMALHGVFAKMFPPGGAIPLDIPRTTPAGMKLPPLALTQFVLDDGWLGVAVGAPRTAAQAAPGESLAAAQ